MKKRWVLCASLFLGWMVTASAFAAKIVAVEGEVWVREGDTGPGEARLSGQGVAAAVGQDVAVSRVIETGDGAQCTVAFDETRQRLAVVRENTSVTLESLGPDEVALTRGRVFALIKPGASSFDFRVKTPTAVSGARGTAWETEFTQGRTSVACLENVVYVMGIDASGATTDPTDLLPGSGVFVEEGGVLGDIFDLSQEQLVQFREDRQALEDVVLPEEEAVIPDSIFQDDKATGADLMSADEFDTWEMSDDLSEAGLDTSSIRDLTDQAKEDIHEKKIYDEQSSAEEGSGGAVVTGP